MDGFADEGHRIGAYYLYRSLCLAFYGAFHPKVALKLASSWLEAMNDHEHSSNIDKFDKEKQTDLFALLSPSDLARPEIAYVRFFFKLFRALNGFTLAVDALFEATLRMPFCTSSEYATAMAYVKEQTASDAMASDDELLKGMMKAAGLSSTEHSRVLLNACLLAIAADSLVDDAADGAERATGDISGSGSADEEAGESVATESATFSLETLMRNALRAQRRSSDGLQGGASADDLSSVSFFSPEFVRDFGGLLGDSSEGIFHRSGQLKVPLDTAAYIACLAKLQGPEILGCDPFHAISQTLDAPTLTSLQLSTRKRWLAYDHVRVIAPPVDADATCITVGIYIARGRPDLWKPETKADHRRVLQPGVWACRRPFDDSDAEFWQARRELALVHGVAPSRSKRPRTRRAVVAIADHKKDDDATDPYAEVVDDADQDGCVVAHFFADMLTFYEMGGFIDGDHSSIFEGVGRKPLDELKVLNTHLGKAGGLNFGIEAILRSDIVPQPTATYPLFFGIIDARHSSDARFWRFVLPEFFEVHEIDDQVC